MVFDFKLHEAHVGRVRELCDDAQTWEQPDRGGNEKDTQRQILKFEASV